MHPVFAEIFGGPEIFIVLGIVALLFGGQQIPKLARSLGQAKHEFEKGSSNPRDTAQASNSADD